MPEKLQANEQSSRLDEVRGAITRSRDAIEAEFSRTANTWIECVGSRVFQLECYLSSEKAKNELGEGVFADIQQKLELLKAKLFKYKEEYPEKEPQPPKEAKEEVVSMLNVIG